MTSSVTHIYLEVASRWLGGSLRTAPYACTEQAYDIKKIFPQVINKTSYLTDIESEYAGKMIERKKFLKTK